MELRVESGGANVGSVNGGSISTTDSDGLGQTLRFDKVVEVRRRGEGSTRVSAPRESDRKER